MIDVPDQRQSETFFPVIVEQVKSGMLRCGIKTTKA